METTLECSVCLNMICEPISISCGHSFCRICLVKSLSRSKKKCPSCRAICHVSAEDANENIMLKAIAKQCNPILYTQRENEIEIEKKNWKKLLPIFYYNMTMFPGETLSLHLFEPRYKLMMRRIADSSRSFAYVPNFVSYAATVGDLALIAEVKELEFLADGRCLLEATLRGRYKIVDHYVEEGTQGLHFCRLDPLHDTPVTGSDLTTLHGLSERARVYSSMALQGDVLSRVTQLYGPPPLPPLSLSLSLSYEAFSIWLTAVCPFPNAQKFHLLRSVNTLDRIRVCVECLEGVLTRLGERVSESVNYTCEDEKERETEREDDREEERESEEEREESVEEEREERKREREREECSRNENNNF